MHIVLVDAINVIFVRKCQIFLLNCKIVIFSIEKLVLQIIKNKFHKNLFCGVYLIVWLIKAIRNFVLRKESQFNIPVWFWIMGRHVDRAFICFLIRQYYLDKQNQFKFCHCFTCKRLKSHLNEIDRWSFYDLNPFHDKWFIILHRKFVCQITLFPVFIWKND